MQIWKAESDRNKPFTWNSQYSFPYLGIRSLRVHSLIRWFADSFVRSFVRSFVHSLVYWLHSAFIIHVCLKRNLIKLIFFEYFNATSSHRNRFLSNGTGKYSQLRRIANGRAVYYIYYRRFKSVLIHLETSEIIFSVGVLNLDTQNESKNCLPRPGFAIVRSFVRRSLNTLIIVLLVITANQTKDIPPYKSFRILWRKL